MHPKLRTTPTSLYHHHVATAPPSTLLLDPVQGEARSIDDWVTTFHLALVVLDPFTYESSWIIKTAARIMDHFEAADVRLAWLVTGTPEQAEEFLGPYAEQFLTFTDPDRSIVSALGLEQLPAFVHLDHSVQVVGSAEGWQPADWHAVAEGLTDYMSWQVPHIPAEGDPTAYSGTPALG